MNFTYNVSFPSACGGQSVYDINTPNETPTQESCSHQSPCNGCVDIHKGECTQYTGSNLTNTGINKFDTLNTILQKLDAIKAIQDTKNANILSALNDINARLNILEGGSHAPYTLI
jgi:hypothetical protein